MAVLLAVAGRPHAVTVAAKRGALAYLDTWRRETAPISATRANT